MCFRKSNKNGKKYGKLDARSIIHVVRNCYNELHQSNISFTRVFLECSQRIKETMIFDYYVFQKHQWTIFEMKSKTSRLNIWIKPTFCFNSICSFILIHLPPLYDDVVISSSGGPVAFLFVKFQLRRIWSVENSVPCQNSKMSSFRGFSGYFSAYWIVFNQHIIGNLQNKRWLFTVYSYVYDDGVLSSSWWTFVEKLLNPHYVHVWIQM